MDRAGRAHQLGDWWARFQDTRHYTQIPFEYGGMGMAGQQHGRTEYHLRIQVIMTDDERDRFQREHALGEHEPVRDRLVTTVGQELDAVGTEAEWWSTVHVH